MCEGLGVGSQVWREGSRKLGGCDQDTVLTGRKKLKILKVAQGRDEHDCDEDNACHGVFLYVCDNVSILCSVVCHVVCICVIGW